MVASGWNPLPEGCSNTTRPAKPGERAAPSSAAAPSPGGGSAGGLPTLASDPRSAPPTPPSPSPAVRDSLPTADASDCRSLSETESSPQAFTGQQVPPLPGVGGGGESGRPSERGSEG